ncbi:hypothetical protein O6H91_17G063100 [Diphasiastrum complanatum]|uniref:Uncharacterized protein n=1 Tax=Diphasiastrum complanatum TaxID=34168 RepID=A0ACC2B7H8_DIPCM|nr:hypothetical protein O6H91_17G063100 [Diphasiastrum complanatum]
MKVVPMDTVRISMSSAVSSSSHGSGQEEGDLLGDVYMWGEGIGEGYLGGGHHKLGVVSGGPMDALLPKLLNYAAKLDIHSIACGGRHAALVTRHGKLFCWGEESGGRLGHGVHVDVSHPCLVEALGSADIEAVACGEYHTCAITLTGELYTWGDGNCSAGLLGHGNNISHWMPKKVNGCLESIRVSSIVCGPWHTALVTSSGQLYTFGEGTFGALGHGDKENVHHPKEVESLKGLKIVRVACGVWHTAAVVEVMIGYSGASSCSSGKLFTWGDGDKGRLGHEEKEQKLVPTCVAALVDHNFSQVACGHSLTVALTSSGRIFTMGSTIFGQLGNPQSDGKFPGLVEGRLCDAFVEEISCGAHHVAALTTKGGIYTWGKGANGRLGHGDMQDRHIPTLVEALKDKQVTHIACGSSFTAAVCSHGILGASQSTCTGCRHPFGFTRKKHHCYNCGAPCCHACSARKILKCSLAPNPDKPYRVCDHCFLKLQKGAESLETSHTFQVKNLAMQRRSVESKEKADLKIPKPYLPLLKVSEEPIRINDGKTGQKRNKKAEFPTMPAIGTLHQWGIVDVPRTFDTFTALAFKVRSSASVPASRVVSRAVSPVSRRPSPPRLTTALKLPGLSSSFDELKKENAKLNLEVLKLQEQLKDMAEKLPAQVPQPGRYSLNGVHPMSVSDVPTVPELEDKYTLSTLCQQPQEINLNTRRFSVISESTFSSPIRNHTSSRSSETDVDDFKSMQRRDERNPVDGAKYGNGHVQGPEWVEQDQPGVYLTLFALPGGGKGLRRVRFSRKRFTEREAEQWWQENRQRVHDQYNVRIVDRTVLGRTVPIKNHL